MEPASHAFAPHVGEIRITLAAPTFEGLCEEAARALVETIASGGDVGRVRRHEDVRVDGVDRAARLVAWIDELLFVVERTGLLPADTQVTSTSEDSLRARVGLAAGPLVVHVKAATWSGLEVVEDARGVRATVVLDV